MAQTQLPDLRVALDLTEEWDALDNGSALLTGVVVARADFVKEHPAAVSNFLEQYSASVDWVNANTAEAAELIGGYDIVDAAVAEKALPYCNIVCVTGSGDDGYAVRLSAACCWDAGRRIRGRRYAQRRLLLRRVTADKFSAPREHPGRGGFQEKGGGR